MKDIIEIKKSINMLIEYPIFAYPEFGDKGNSCVGRLDRMNKMKQSEIASYGDTYSAVVQAMPKYSMLHQHVGRFLMDDFGLKKFPNYDTTVKILTRILEDDYQLPDSKAVEKLEIRVKKYQQIIKTCKC